MEYISFLLKGWIKIQILFKDHFSLISTEESVETVTDATEMDIHNP